jgi:hypothetical protein
VSRPDRRELLSYLDGEVDTTSSIDRNAPLEIAMQRPLPYVKQSASTTAGAGAATSASITPSLATATGSSLSGAQKRPMQISDETYEEKSDLTNTNASLQSSVKVTKASGAAQELMDTSEILDTKSSTQSEQQQQQSQQQQQQQQQKQQQQQSQSQQLLPQVAGTSSASQQSSAFIDRITKKFDETAAQSTRPITENIMPLSEQLTLEKIASIKAKKKAQQRKQVSSGVEIDDVDLMAATAASTHPSASTESSSLTASQSASNRQQLSQSARLTSDFGASMLTTSSGAGSISSSNQFMSGLGPLIGTDESNAIMNEINQRERVWRTRYTVLQSTGKQFDLNAFFQAIKAKEEGTGGGADVNGGNVLSQFQPLSAINNSNISNTQMSQQQQQQQQQQLSQVQKARSFGYNRFDQERYGAKDETGGFSIDTKLTYQPNGGAINLTPNPNAPPPPPSTSALSSQMNDKSLTQSSSQPNKLSNSSQISQQKVNSSFSKPSAANITPSPPQKRLHTRPIIIIPAARTSLITMINASDILQDLK